MNQSQHGCMPVCSTSTPEVKCILYADDSTLIVTCKIHIYVLHCARDLFLPILSLVL